MTGTLLKNDLELEPPFTEMRKAYVRDNDGNSPLEGHKSLDEAIELDSSPATSTYVKAQKKKSSTSVLP